MLEIDWNTSTIFSRSFLLYYWTYFCFYWSQCFQKNKEVGKNEQQQQSFGLF